MSEQCVLFGESELQPKLQLQLCTNEQNLVWSEFIRSELSRSRREVNEDGLLR